jgi:membrane fusion protein (multidrug efflux system)
MTDTRSVPKLDVDRDLALSDKMLVPVAFREPMARKTTPRRLNRRSILTLVIAFTLIAAAAAYGRYYWVLGRFLESTDDAYVQADSTIIAPKVSGYLSQVLVEDNQPVKAAQLLAKIDDRDYVASLDQAKADVATAQADIETITATLAQQQAVIAQARATVAVDQANLTYAEQENARYGSLAKIGGASVELAQQAASKRDTAQAALTRDTAAVTAAEEQVGVLQAQLAKDKATLQHYEAVQEQAR